MTKEIIDHLERAFVNFSSSQQLDVLIKAKNDYFKLTGTIDEDSDNYEAKMASFNDWYLTQYKSDESASSLIETYLLKNNIDSNVNRILLNMSHSIFECLGTSITGRQVFKDIITKKKFFLIKEHPEIGIIKNDLFVGRAFILDKEIKYMMIGKCFPPRNVKPILKKQAKKTKAKDDLTARYQFLMMTEKLNGKFHHYNHAPLEKIFTYE